MKTSIIAISALALSTAAFATSDMKNKSSSSDRKSDIKVSEINRNPQKFLNKKVTVRGEVEKMSSDSKAFVLDGEGAMNDQILVINKDGMKDMSASGTTSATTRSDTSRSDTASSDTSTAGSTMASSTAIKDEDEVELSGTVRRMSASDIERAYSLELDSSLKDEMKGAIPVIVADAKSFQLMRAK